MSQLHQEKGSFFHERFGSQFHRRFVFFSSAMLIRAEHARVQSDYSMKNSPASKASTVRLEKGIGQKKKEFVVWRKVIGTSFLYFHSDVSAPQVYANIIPCLLHPQRFCLRSCHTLLKVDIKSCADPNCQ